MWWCFACLVTAVIPVLQIYLSDGFETDRGIHVLVLNQANVSRNNQLQYIIHYIKLVSLFVYYW